MTLSHTIQSAGERTAAALEKLRKFHRTHPGLFVVLVFTLVTRVAIYVVGQPWDEEVITSTILDGDALVYHRIALEFLDGASISELSWAADRTFGYPYFVTAIYAISNNGIWLVLAVQSLLNFLMVPMVYWASRTLFNSQKTGTVAAGMFALSAIPVAWAARYLFTETLFTFVLLIFVIVYLHAWKRESVRWFLLLGVLLGIGSVVRSVLQFFVVIPVLIILLQDRRVLNKIAVASAVVVGLLVTIAPFQLINYNQYGHYSLSTISGNVLFKSIAAAKARADGTDFYEARDSLGWQEWVDIENPFEHSAVSKSHGIRYVLSEPKDFVILHVQGMVSFLLGTEKSSYLYVIFRQDRPDLANPLNFETFTERIVRNIKNIQKEYFLTPVLVIKLLAEYLVISIGFIILFRRKQKTLALFLFLWIAYFILVTAFMGRAPRYKIPVLPIYAIVGGGGAMLVWTYLRSWINSRRRLPQ